MKLKVWITKEEAEELGTSRRYVWCDDVVDGGTAVGCSTVEGQYVRDLPNKGGWVSREVL